MNNTDEEQLATLEAEAQSIERALVTKAGSWALDQGVFGRAFLMQEARLAVINQAEVTERIAGEVPVLKAEIEEICNDMTATFERWSASVGLVDATTLAQDPRKVFLELTGPAHEAFGEAFVRRGYDSGSGSRDSTGETSNWHFYIPETGTARNSFMNYDRGAGQVLSDLWNSWSTLTWKVKTAKDQIQRSRAAHIWDTD